MYMCRGNLRGEGVARDLNAGGYCERVSGCKIIFALLRCVAADVDVGAPREEVKFFLV